MKGTRSSRRMWRCLTSELGGIARDADVQRLPLPHDLFEREHAFLERGLGVGPVVIEDVDVIEPHSRQALIEACDQVLAGTTIAVRPRPHRPAGLVGDDQLITVRREIAAQDATERDLGAPRLRAVVVGEIEVRDAEVECPADHRARFIEWIDAAEVVPEPEGDRGKGDPASAATAVGHPFVSCVRVHALRLGIRIGRRQGHRYYTQTTAIGRTRYGLSRAEDRREACSCSAEYRTSRHRWPSGRKHRRRSPGDEYA